MSEVKLTLSGKQRFIVVAILVVGLITLVTWWSQQAEQRAREGQRMIEESSRRLADIERRAAELDR